MSVVCPIENELCKIEIHVKEAFNMPTNTKIQPADADWILSSELLTTC
jgi:hypothetical protein